MSANAIDFYLTTAQPSIDVKARLDRMYSRSSGLPHILALGRDLGYACMDTNEIYVGACNWISRR